MDIFVGSLPFKIKEGELSALFEEYGEVRSVKIILDKVSRQSKGFGFVEMSNKDEAVKAIKALNGFEIMGRTIIVSKSEEKGSVRNRDFGKEGRDSGARGAKDSRPRPGARSGPGTRTSSAPEAGAGARKPRFDFKKKEKPKKPNVIGRYNDDKKEGPKKPARGVKLAKNFKVGARKRKG